MTNYLTPVAGWDQVFQIEVNTPVLGGPGGPDNEQAQNLLNRFAYLEGGSGSTKVGYTPVAGPSVDVQVQLRLHDSEIAANTADIATNTGDIATNTAAIVQLNSDYDSGANIANVATFRTNLDVWSKGEADARYLDEASNLSDLDNVATARTNLDVYSKAETDAAVAAGFSSSLKVVASGVATDSTKNRDLLSNITIDSYSKDTGVNTATWTVSVSGLATAFTSTNFVVVASGYNLAFGSGTFVDGNTFNITGYYADNGMDATSSTVNFAVFMV